VPPFRAPRSLGVGANRTELFSVSAPATPQHRIIIWGFEGSPPLSKLLGACGFSPLPSIPACESTSDRVLLNPPAITSSGRGLFFTICDHVVLFDSSDHVKTMHFTESHYEEIRHRTIVSHSYCRPGGSTKRCLAIHSSRTAPRLGLIQVVRRPVDS
jgi:hypothetical protein